MGRSLESLSKSRNMDMGKDPEGIAHYADKPKTFEEAGEMFLQMVKN